VFRHGRLPQTYYFIDMELCDLSLDHYIYQQWTPAMIEVVPYFTAELPSRFRVSQIWNVMEDITRGVAFLHLQNHVHRDIKPRNSISSLVFLTPVLYSHHDQSWKLADFGLTAEGTSRSAHTSHSSRGTGGYRAPELLQESKATCNNKVDIWSVGCVLYELVAEDKLFATDWAAAEYARTVRSGTEVVNILNKLGKTILDESRRDFVRKVLLEMLQIEPSRRPGADGLYQKFTTWGTVEIESQRMNSTVSTASEIRVVPAQSTNVLEGTPEESEEAAISVGKILIENDGDEKRSALRSRPIALGDLQRIRHIEEEHSVSTSSIEGRAAIVEKEPENEKIAELGEEWTKITDVDAVVTKLENLILRHPQNNHGSLAATATSSSSCRIYFQDVHGGIREAAHDAGVWTVSNSALFTAKMFTPLSAVSWDEGKEVRHKLAIE
jgi:serine/threonine protein kinase